MPRALTDEERARVSDRLLTKGRERFIRVGLAKTTIAALAKDAGIGKGSFYQFYPSKEALFLAVAQHEEQRFRAELLQALEDEDDAHAKIRCLLRAPFDRLEHHPFLRLLLDAETVAALSVRLDPQALRDNEAGDRAFFVEIARRWSLQGVLRKGTDPEEVFAAMAGLFLIALQRDALSNETGTRAVHTIVTALVERWTTPSAEHTVST